MNLNYLYTPVQTIIDIILKMFNEKLNSNSKNEKQ